MAYWILQANPARYRVAEAIAEADSIRTWTVARQRRAIVPGDRRAPGWMPPGQIAAKEAVAVTRHCS